MALNIKNQDVEALVDEMVRMTGESKTEAVRRALEERLQRLALSVPGDRDEERIINFLQDEIWPQIPQELRGTKLSKEEEEQLLGYGELGV
jgi:antitoxin VapB